MADESMGSFSSRDVELFRDFLKKRGTGGGVDFEEFCRAHPDSEPALRRWQEDWAEASRGFESGSSTTERSEFVERLFQQLSSSDQRTRRYELIEPVAQGAMGSIFKVWDYDLQRHLAMKVVRIEDERDADAMLSRFHEEAQITAQLDHPGVVPVHELGISGGRLYFTMRLVRGDDFHRVIERVHDGEPEWTLTRALGVLLKVCEAVAYAHTKGVIHRDLKPANVMVGRFGETYTMDWGLGRVLGRARPQPSRPDTMFVDTARRHEKQLNPEHRTMGVLGTPAYMPPEQARADFDKVGRPSDVYALGAMLYHLLVGHPPYMREGLEIGGLEVHRRLLEGPPEPPEQLAEDAPPELIAICAKAMARERRERYADMRDVAEDLRAYLEGRPVSVRAATVGYLGRLWIRRHAGVAATMLVALLLLVAGGIWAWASISVRETEVSNAERRTARAEQEADVHLSEAKKAQTRATRNAALKDIALARAKKEQARAERNAALKDVALAQAFGQKAANEDASAARLVYAAKALDLQPNGRAGAEYRGQMLVTAGISSLKWASPSRADKILQITASWDGARLASSDEEQDVSVWEHESGEEIFHLTGESKFAAIHPDGQRLATAAMERVRIWSIREQDVLREWKSNESEVHAIGFNDDGTFLALAGADGFHVWDLVGNGSGSPTPVISVETPTSTFVFAGDIVVTGENNGRVSFWDLKTKALLAEDQAHEGDVSGLHFHPALDLLASISGGRIQWWKASTAEKRGAFELGQEIKAFAFEPGGSRFVVSGDAGLVAVATLDPLVGVARVRASDELVLALAWTVAGHVVAGADDGGLRIWDAETWQLEAHTLGHQDRINTVAISPDGTRVLSGDSDKRVLLWSRVTGELLAQTRISEEVLSAAFAPDGETVAVGSGSGRLYLFDAKLSGRLGMRRTGHYSVLSVDFLGKGHRIVTAGHDGKLRVWDAASLEPVSSFTHAQGAAEGSRRSVTQAVATKRGEIVASCGLDGWVRLTRATAPHARVLEINVGYPLDALALSPDGTELAVGALGSSDIRVYGMADGIQRTAMRTSTEQSVSSLVYVGAKRLVSATGKTVSVWNTTNGDFHAIAGHSGRVRALASSRTGSYLATGGTDKIVRLWELQASFDQIGSRGCARGFIFEGPNRFLLADESGLERRTAAGVERLCDVTVLSLSYGGGTVAVGCANGDVSMWRGREAPVKLAQRVDAINAVAVSASGRWVASGGRDYVVRRWDVGHSPPRLKRFERHSGRVFGLVFSPDERLLASVSRDGSICIWDIVSGEYEQHELDVELRGVAFHPHRPLLVAAGWNWLHVWNTRTRKAERLPLRGKKAICVAFSPSGAYLASAERGLGRVSGSVRIWDTKSWEEIAILPWDDVTSIAFNASGDRMACCAEPGQVRLVDLTVIDWSLEQCVERTGLVLQEGVAVPMPRNRLISPEPR